MNKCLFRTLAENMFMGFNAFYTFFIGSWLFILMTPPRQNILYIQGFRGIFCYILGVKLKDLATLNLH